MVMDTMDIMRIWVDRDDVRLGNVLYFIAFCFKKVKSDKIILYYTNPYFNRFKGFLNFEFVEGKPSEYDFKLTDFDFVDFLNPSQCDFDRLGGFINDKYKHVGRFPFDTSNMCVVHLRIGDKADGNKNFDYKIPNLKWLRSALDAYGAWDYDIVVISDDIERARFYFKDDDNVRFFFGSTTESLCLMMTAKLIIGSCSLFSFCGLMLNTNGARLIVDYPYLKEMSKFDAMPFERLYDDERAVKHTLPKDAYVERACVCAIIKDEQDYLDEWIRHNLSIGFSEIYLYEDYGSMPHDEICQRYSNVHLISVSSVVSKKDFKNRQGLVYERFMRDYRLEFDFCAFIDIDEFIMFEDGWNLKKLLREFIDDNGVCLYWKQMTANGHIFKPKGGVVDSYKDYLVDYKHDSMWNMKTILNMNHPFLRIKYVHWCDSVFNTMHLMTRKIRCYRKAWINHYYTKSLYEYLMQLVQRGDAYYGNRKLNGFWIINKDMAKDKRQIMRSLFKCDGEIPNTVHLISRGVIDDGEREYYQSIFPSYDIIVWDSTSTPKDYLDERLSDMQNEALVRSRVLYERGGIGVIVDGKRHPLEKIGTDKPTILIDGDFIAYSMPKSNFIDEMCLKKIDTMNKVGYHDYDMREFTNNMISVLDLRSDANFKVYG